MKPKVISLFSGGLDSILIIYLMQDLGFDVLPVCFSTPFFPPNNAIKIAKENNFSIKIVDITDDYLEMLKSPSYGYGKNLNPCINCHGMMLNKAYEIMLSEKAAFICSGEVVSQRPMSQTKNSLAAVDKVSKVKEHIIRPLSQKLLPDTKPILNGLVDKEKLLDISGRSRKRQHELAEKFNLPSIPSSGGGCLLTDIGYCKRLQDIFDYDMLEKKYLKFLHLGRHFRIDDCTKFILGKNQGENNYLTKNGAGEFAVRAKNFASPLGIIQSKSEIDQRIVELCGGILLRYCNKVAENQETEIYCGALGTDFATTTATKMADMELEKFKIN